MTRLVQVLSLSLIALGLANAVHADEKRRETLALEVMNLTGMSEIGAFHWGCREKKYHVQPYVVPFLLDPETSAPLPRKGRQTGRAAFYDILNRSHWGGIISGDEITIDWDTPCPCGLQRVAIEHEIMRYSEKEGVEDDRITCNATVEVHDEALNFMKAFEG